MRRCFRSWECPVSLYTCRRNSLHISDGWLAFSSDTGKLTPRWWAWPHALLPVPAPHHRRRVGARVLRWRPRRPAARHCAAPFRGGGARRARPLARSPQRAGRRRGVRGAGRRAARADTPAPRRQRGRDPPRSGWRGPGGRNAAARSAFHRLSRRRPSLASILHFDNASPRYRVTDGVSIGAKLMPAIISRGQLGP